MTSHPGWHMVENTWVYLSGQYKVLPSEVFFFSPKDKDEIFISVE